MTRIMPNVEYFEGFFKEIEAGNSYSDSFDPTKFFHIYYYNEKSKDLTIPSIRCDELIKSWTDLKEEER